MDIDTVVRALRICNRPKGHRCSECPIFGRYEHRTCKATVDKAAADLIESLQAQLKESQEEAKKQHYLAFEMAGRADEAQRRANAAVECIEKIDDWNNHFCYHDLEEIIDEWRGVKEEGEKT